MLYLIYYDYSSGNAAINRLMGYLKEFSKACIDTTVVFIYPDDKQSTVDLQMPHIKFRYLWKEFYYNPNKLIEFFLRKIYPILFKRWLKAGDVVYTYGFGEFQHYSMGVKGVSYYHERTEHPEALGKAKPFISFSPEKYYNDCKKLDGLFVISTCLKDFFSSKGVPSDRIHIINMTVDPSRFVGLKKIPSERYIAYCGVIYNTKDGVDLLIESFAYVARKHPDVKLYIIGPIPGKKDSNVNFQLVDYLGLKDNVVFTGRIPAEEMPQMLKNAEICALCRPDGLRARAGFPTKLGEYLLTENPVVITKVGDIPLFLEDGKSAILVEPDNPVLFAERLNWLIEHKNEAIQIGKEGAQVANNSFSAEIETKKIIEIIFSNEHNNCR